MPDLILISEAATRYPLCGRRIRQLAVAGMGCRQGGRWLVSEFALSRHVRGLPAIPPARPELADMLREASDALRENRPEFAPLMARILGEFTHRPRPADEGSS